MKNNKIDVNKIPLFTVIPGTALSDDNLKANEKLLLSVIISYARLNGYAWAGNIYLSEIFGVHKKTISEWVNNLVKYEYVSTDINSENDRKIFLLPKSLIGINKNTNTPIQEKPDTPIHENTDTPIHENTDTYPGNHGHNNIIEYYNNIEYNNSHHGTMVLKNSVMEETKVSSTPQSPSKKSSVKERERLPQYDLNKFTNEKCDEVSITVPKSVVLTYKQRELLDKRKKSKSINNTTVPKKINKTDKLIDIANRIHSVMQTTMIVGLESIYQPTVDFNWYHAAKKLNDTIQNDDRYAEFKLMIDKKTDIDEINLLYYIIKNCNTVKNFQQFLVKDNITSINDVLIYSMIFKNKIYESNINKLYKDYRNKLNKTYNEMEKEQYNN